MGVVMLDLLKQSIVSVDHDYSNVGGVASISDMFAIIINVLLGVTFAISLVGIAYAFVQYIVSMGDKDAIKNAQKALTWSVIAMLVSFLAVILKTAFFKLIGTGSDYNSN